MVPDINNMEEDSTVHASVIPEDHWPKVARLSMGGLMQQSHIIREICRDAIKIVEVTLVTEQAWPELHKGTHYKRQVLLDAVNALRHKIKNNLNDDGKLEQDNQ